MSSAETILNTVKSRFAHEPTFLQAVTEIISTLVPYWEKRGEMELWPRLDRLLTPERIVSFKVLWTNDAGQLCHNVGYRVQFNSALGPYKGGLRFDKSVNQDVLKFLGFEQIFKNALTGLPLGGAKGGSDFDPKGKSDNEIRNFCRAFMIELHRHIGLDSDVPAGDMGVGGREIGYMVGMYRELTHSFNGALTGKDPLIGGSFGRTEATGHGVVYFARAMLREKGVTLKGLRCVVSGSGNVAEHTARKLLEEGALVLTLSDRTGYIYKETGLSQSDIDQLQAHKKTGENLDTLRLPDVDFVADTPWQKVIAEAYFPCATQNEIDAAAAKVLAKQARLVVEGANMPLTNEAIQVLHDARVAHAPGKASNAGGVAVSGLEMVQNASHYPWTAAEVEVKLVTIMEGIHEQCKVEGQEDWGIDYVKGANIAGAKRVLAAMEKLGW